MTRLVVMGAGLIGQRHIAHIQAQDGATLAAIIDPAAPARAVAAACGVPWYADFAAMMAAGRPDGVVVATPNQMHVRNGLDCLAAGLPVLMEKPLADDVAGAERLVAAAEAAGVALLVGHHRRHNPLIRAAKAYIETGALGRIVAVQAMCWFRKPEEYFDQAWRRAPGAGPVLLNLIHDIDLLRHLCGDIASVQAVASNAQRGFAVEDTAAILLRFAAGGLGTLSVSDSIAAPWSWELTSGENAAYEHTREACCMIGGTLASLSIPQLDVWKHANRPSWMERMASTRLGVTGADPLALQIGHFCAVIEGRAAPLVPGREGLANLRVIAAIKEAAESGEIVHVQ